VLLRLDDYVALGKSLACKDVAAGFLFFRQGILSGHVHLAGKQLNSARAAGARPARIVDEDAGLIGCVKNSGARKNRG
jgi:hypothetical protein